MTFFKKRGLSVDLWINIKMYSHIFFDLDRTLWDFETNARITLDEIFKHFCLGERGIPSTEDFEAVYKIINEQMWDGYRKGRISKDVLRTERYQQTLEHFGIHDEPLSQVIGTYYVERSPQMRHLISGTIEVLEYQIQNYQLHIITNGFEEAQHIKMNSSNLTGYFNQVVTSEMTGEMKPHPLMFEAALSLAGATVEESVMIGDDLEVDILAAKNIGMDQVYFNPEGTKHKEEVTHEIGSLLELKKLL